MDAATWIAVAAGAITSVGGFLGGRKTAASDALATAAHTVSLLESQLQVIQAREVEKEEIIRNLTSRIEVLESLVLQREDLVELKRDVYLIKEKLNA